MRKHFYHSVVETSSISIALAELDMNHEERKHLVSLVEENLHHAILDSVLSELSDKDKQEFVELYAQGDDEKIWKLLKSRVDNIEDKIILEQIHKQIRVLIEELPYDQREVVIMRHFGNMSFKEIAEVTNVSINTSLGRMRYALINLRKLIKEKDLYLNVS